MVGSLGQNALLKSMAAGRHITKEGNKVTTQQSLREAGNSHIKKDI